MGLNFKNITHGKVGQIIPPAYNGTNGFWTRSEWHIVMEVDKLGFIIHRAIVYDHATIRTIEIIQQLGKIR